MFRFIHAADVHLDSPLQGLEAYEGAPVERLRGATRRALENLTQLAIEEQVHFVVIAGDVYDGDWKDYPTGRFFISQMLRLREHAIPVYLISGNHDAESVITRSLTMPDNVHVFSTRVAETKTLPNIPVAIHGRGFPHREVTENLVPDYPDPQPGTFNLGLLHTSLNGRAGHDTYAPCSVKDLQNKGYDYWALGHIHQPEVISKEPWIVFSGNCQGRSVRETGERGCRLVTVDDSLRVERADWCCLDVVRWQVLEVELTGVDSESDVLKRVKTEMDRAIRNADGRLLASRLRLVGRTSLHGSLIRETARWQAELRTCAEERGRDEIWLEQIRVATTPVYSLEQLAQRDALTRTALESLQSLDWVPESLPSEVLEVLDLLPVAVRQAIHREWEEDQGDQILSDVKSLVLDVLQSVGSDDSGESEGGRRAR